jgi:glycerophosphoryl diester phosphodiesterase
MQVIAHRGASGYAPENTRAAFDLAIEMGADAIETDLQITRDGELVLIHDDRVDRTSDGTGPVADFTLAELQALDAGSWFDPGFAGERVMTFTEGLADYGDRIPLCLEIKDPLATVTFLHAVQRLPLPSATQVTSFSWSAVLAAREALPVTIGFLSKTFDHDIIHRCLARGIDQICPPVALLDRALVETAHELGLAVRAWGVRDRTDVDRVIESRADGATVNWPDWLIAPPSHN